MVTAVLRCHDDATRVRARWQPPRTAITVGGHHLTDGMLYLGHGLPSVRGDRVEPALIDPDLPVDSSHPDTADLGYWPAYDAIRPASRAAYLGWLASGRRDPGVPTGFVFLFFYGLERRLLHDEDAEIPQLRAEVRRLLEVYGAHASFRRYANGLLAVTDCGDTPIGLRRELGRCAVEGRPVSASQALAWARHHPDIPVHAPARRCAEEFQRLFALRYGAGIRPAPDGPELRVDYQPASAGLAPVSRTHAGIPDVFSADRPVRRLTAVVASVTGELGAYSRWLGRHPGLRNTLTAAARLPVALLADDAASAALRQWLEHRLPGSAPALIDAAELLGRWPATTALSQDHATGLATLLERLGVGIEPDVRFGGSPLAPGEPAAIFRADAAPSDAYPIAAAVFHLTGDELPLGEPDRGRFAARQLLGNAPYRLDGLSPRQRTSVGDALMTRAAARPFLGPDEIAELMTTFRRLGLDPDTVASRLHASLTAARPVPAGDPVTVRPAGRSTDDYRLPPRTGLDHGVIRAKLAETADVAALLDRLFADDAPPAGTPPATPPPGVPPEVAGSAKTRKVAGSTSSTATAQESDPAQITGLDAAHSALLRRLAERPSWSYDDFAALAAEAGLLPAGAIDAINEAALDAADEPLITEASDLTIDPDILQELRA